MGFNIFEIAGFLGRPLCLYEFTWGNDIYRYTSADIDIPWNGFDWTAIPIKDNGFSIGVSDQEFVIELPRSNEIVQLFRATPPSLPISIVCRRFHKDDPDEEAAVYWVGTIGNIKGRDAITAEIIGLPISRTTRRTGLRACWERQCIHALYGPGCEVDKEDFRVDTTITALTGNTVTVAGIGGYGSVQFAGGFLEWEATINGTIDRRAIERCDGLVMTILGSTDRLIVGQDVAVFLGCDLTPETCQGTFNNLPNHGGFSMLAGKSPFDGNPVF